LMEQEGSKRDDTWGINLYPEKSGEDGLRIMKNFIRTCGEKK